MGFFTFFLLYKINDVCLLKNYMLFGPEYLHGIKDSEVQQYDKVRLSCFLS